MYSQHKVKNFNFIPRNKSFTKAFSLAIDINDADLFMILHKCAKSLGDNDLANEAFKKVEEIYAKEEDESHRKSLNHDRPNNHANKFNILDSTCSITSCSICSNSYHTDSENESEEEIYEQENNQEVVSDEEYTEVKRNSKSPEREMKKSYSTEILNHPPLPRFPRFDVKNFPNKNERVPPLPNFESVENVARSKTSVSSMTSELTLQNVTKFNKSASSTSLPPSKNPYRNAPSTSTFDPVSLFSTRSHHTIREILPSTKNLPEIDQTLGIPLNYDAVDNSLNPYYTQMKDGNDFQPSTTIHTYPLISGTIPSMTIGSQLKNLNTVPLASSLSTSKKEPGVPTNSILSNSNNVHPTNSNSNANKKEGVEKNKVKFSDTIQVAVVPEISRKEKIINYSERVVKRKIYPPGFDPIKRELAESLPLCHPNEEYLKDFLPAPPEKSKDYNSKDEKKKPSIKVVNFGVL